MSEYILLGSEQVERAGINLKFAAEEMKTAASNIDDVFFRQQRFLEDWLQKFQEILENNINIKKD
jgi:hypothetical protein